MNTFEGWSMKSVAHCCLYEFLWRSVTALAVQIQYCRTWYCEQYYSFECILIFPEECCSPSPMFVYHLPTESEINWKTTHFKYSWSSTSGHLPYEDRSLRSRPFIYEKIYISTTSHKWTPPVSGHEHLLDMNTYSEVPTGKETSPKWTLKWS